MANWIIYCDCGNEVLSQQGMDVYGKMTMTLLSVEEFICSDCRLEEIKESLE